MSAQYPATFPVDNALAAKKCIEVAQEVAKRNPPKPQYRSVEEIRKYLFELVGEKHQSVYGHEGLLPRGTRLLSEATEKQAEVGKALKTVKEKITELEKNNQKGSAKYQELAGYSYFSKTYQAPQFADGSLQLLEARLAELNKLVEARTLAVVNAQARVDKERPVLEAELRAARQREALHR